eukprot:TRINITY_DN91520_c0_g1_i1.p1 TRINITY_DN91520_c0_g1~~TRINITY_DN91520_c0_g1_i1.p1  ORF type:complete len:348 (+),score=96.22 TRINITY_DN91520_c0_g1_i1:33-1046(+)
MSSEDLKAAELASLLEIELDAAVAALAASGGNLAAAIDLLSTGANAVGGDSDDHRLTEAAAAAPETAEPAAPAELPLQEASERRPELQALSCLLEPRDFLPILCATARSRLQQEAGVRSSVAAAALLKHSPTDMSVISMGGISLHSTESQPVEVTASDQQGSNGNAGDAWVLPLREADILRGTGRLLQRLEKCGLRSRLVADDGNCLFRACAMQLYRGDENGDQHMQVRRRAVAEMQERPDNYEALFGSKELFDAYLVEMGQAGVWGEELALRAIADAYGAMVHVLTSTEDNWYLLYRPAVASGYHIFLTYIAPIHYNSFEIKPLDPSDVHVQVRAK